MDAQNLVFAPESEGAPPPQRVRLMGMPIDPITQQQAIEQVLSALSAGRGGWVITPNLDQLRLYCERPDLRDMYERASLVLPDGMPLLWASRLQDTPLPQRVAGSELIYTLTEAAAAAGRSIYFLGGNPGSAQGAADELARRYRGLRVAGTHCPPMGFEHRPEEMRAVEESLQATQPDIVYVGLGFPKQERLIAKVRDKLPGAWFLGIGISFSFVSGEIRRAPRWMQRTGMEWMHRMVQEPGRLFRRYIIEDMPFAAKLLWSAARRSGGPGH